MENSSSGKTFSFRQRLQSFRYAFRGIGFMIKTQHNFWVHFVITFLVIAAGLFFRISLNDWMLIILAIGLVLSAETFNTAIEQLTDLVHPDTHPVAGRVKDVAAGAVLLAALAAAFIGLLIFVPKIMAIL